MAQAYDVVVIGAGPGGYIAAIRAAQLGMNVACIEGWRNESGELSLGGTCLNVGCIPSKALLASSEAYELVRESYDAHGIGVDGLRLDIGKMQARKAGIVKKMTKGIEFLFRKNKVTWLKGFGRFVGYEDDAYRIEVADEEADGAPAQLVDAKHVIIATGSKPRALPGLEVDNRIVCDNVGALAMTEVPARLGVIGAGVIGLELGSVWRRLGAEVTVLEALPTFLAAADEGVRKEAWKQFKAQGLRIELDARIAGVEVGDSGARVRYSIGEGEPQTLDCDRLIVSVGRVPNTEGLGLDAIDLAVDERGFVPVDEHCRTKAPNVWAIGDVVRGPMLAHKAEDEGVMVAERIAGQDPHIDYGMIPWVIYTSPEIAWVGRTEEQLKKEGRAFKAGQFPFSANGRALGTGHSAGFVKVLADAATDEVLGVHIVSGAASELIAEATLAMEFRASAEDIGRVSHPHPSMSEALREASLAATDKRSLNA
ncbi:MAG: dihydrolipoyl dehydrogenase [Burkholderiales bacterium]|jgi:dihydrolipoamide dehydrogenase|nr:MAG: dihydrolipoyl dehydrogenase [Burkholderiales bacterium]